MGGNQFMSDHLAAQCCQGVNKKTTLKYKWLCKEAGMWLRANHQPS
jgi:hypothetical protein